MNKAKHISIFKSAICLLLCIGMILSLAGCQFEVKEDSPVSDENPAISQEDNEEPLISQEDNKDNEESLISQENKQADEITDTDKNLPVVKTQNEVSLSSDEQYEINIFLSNFSEQWFYEHKTEDFSVESADISELIRFVFIHRNINGPNSFQNTVDENGYVNLSIDDINYTLNRFFGISITLNDAKESGYLVKNNLIYDMYGIGESYNHLTIVDSVKEGEDGTYLVSFNIYALDLDSYFADGIDKDYYYLDSASAKNRTDLSLHLSGKAIVKPYTTNNNRNTYQLISYRLVNNNNKTDTNDNNSIPVEDIFDITDYCRNYNTVPYINNETGLTGDLGLEIAQYGETTQIAFSCWVDGSEQSAEDFFFDYEDGVSQYTVTGNRNHSEYQLSFDFKSDEVTVKVVRINDNYKVVPTGSYTFVRS